MKPRDYITDILAVLGLLAILYGFLIVGAIFEQGAL